MAMQTTKFPEYVDAYDALPNSLMRYEDRASVVAVTPGQEHHLRAHECVHGSRQGGRVSVSRHVRYARRGWLVGRVGHH